MVILMLNNQLEFVFGSVEFVSFERSEKVHSRDDFETKERDNF